MIRARWYWTLTLGIGVLFTASTAVLTLLEFLGGRGPILLTLGGVTLSLVGGIGVSGGTPTEEPAGGVSDDGSDALELGLVLGVGASLLTILVGLALTAV